MACPLFFSLFVSTSASSSNLTGAERCKETTFSHEDSSCAHAAPVAAAGSVEEGGSTAPCSAAVSESTVSSSDTPEGKPVARDPSLRTTESKMEEIRESQSRIQRLVEAQVIYKTASVIGGRRLVTDVRNAVTTPLFDAHRLT